MGDLEPFVSPIDGSVITGRAALREHNKRHNVTNVADYNKPGGQWEKQAKEREKFFTGQGYNREQRREALKQSYSELKNYSQYKRMLEGKR